MTWFRQNTAAFHGETRWAAFNDDKHSFGWYGGDLGDRRRDLSG
jgi:hypothetical protein